jgi:Acetyltransferase (GNAT) domain
MRISIKRRLNYFEQIHKDSHLKPATSPTPIAVARNRPSLQSSNKLTILELKNDRWQGWLDRTRHDLYHTANYHGVEAEANTATGYLAVYGNADKFVALPYLLKSILTCGGSAYSAVKEVTSAYGYSGPLACNCQNDIDFLNQAWRAISREWANQGAISAFVRFHPIVGNALWFEGRSTIPNGAGPDGSLALVGNTVAIDLSNTPESIWYGYSRQVRQAVRRCSSSGIVVEEDPAWKYLEDFVGIYHKTMERNNAGDFYFFPARYLRSLKAAVGEHASLMVARYEGKVISAAILFEYDGIVNLYLLATDSEYLKLSPSKAVLHASQEWAKARGNRIFHLGGGRKGRADEPLFQFKAAFSSQFFPFYVGRWILNQSAYDFLTEQRKQEAADLESKTVDSSYFPAYRAPLIEATNSPC